MDTPARCTQCKHCDQVFFTRPLWLEHHDWHSDIQKQLCRPSSNTETTSEEIDGLADHVSRVRISGSQSPVVIQDMKGNYSQSKNIREDLTEMQMVERLRKIMVEYPPYEDDENKERVSCQRLKCDDCEMSFYTSAQLDKHYLSKYCRGNQIVVYAMVIDSSNAGGYRVEKREIPFESKRALFKCTKCTDGFLTEDEKRQHEKSHPFQALQCLHCQKAFTNEYELEEHYRHHDDIHLRHHIDSFRTKSEDVFRKWSPGDSVDTSETSRPIQNPWIRKGGLPRADGDLVAISLISKESLENRYAPDGTFRSPQPPRRPHSVLSKPERFKSIKGFFKRKSEAKQKHPQHSLQTPTVENQRKEWKLAYLHESSTWVVSSGSDGWTQSYTLGESRRETYQRSQSTQPANLSGSALPVHDILTQIGTYAKSHAIQNVAGLRKIMGIPPSLHQVNGAHVGSLRCWLDDEKRNSGREGLCPESGVTILSNGFSKRLLAWDTCGRHRLIDGQDLCRIVPAVIGHPNGDLETVRLSLGAVAQYLLQSGNVRAAEELYWDLFEAIRTLDGSLDLEFIVLCGLGHTYNKQEMRERAIMMHMKALDSCENIYGSSGVNSFTILTQMATNYERLGQIANAMGLYQRALQGRLDCDQQEDALDDKEKLGELNQALGRNTQAARLFDEVYRGFQELLGPHHRKTLLAMTNLSALLFATGHTDRGISLLLTAVPLAYRILGPDDQVSMACVCNYLIYSPTTRLPPSIQTVTDQYLSRNNQSSLNVLKSLAELYGKKGMGRQAVETYKLLSERIKSVSGTSNPMILDALYGYAFSLQCVGRFSESMEQYRHLHSLAVTLHPAQSQSWINIVKISLERLNKTKADLDQENLDWGLDVPQVCSDETCPNMTTRVCSKCKMNRFCSLTCESRSREAYHQAWCIASVTISESMSVLIKYTNDHINRDSMAASLMLNLRLLRKPRCVSFKTVFINPITFMTLRISKKPENLLVVYPSPTTSLRFGVQNSMPFQWMTTENCGALLIERRADAYLIVAPEKNKMADLQGERDKNFGIESDEVDLPGEDLIEYAQWTEKSGGKTTFVSAFALVEWSVE